MDDVQRSFDRWSVDVVTAPEWLLLEARGLRVMGEVLVLGCCGFFHSSNRCAGKVTPAVHLARLCLWLEGGSLGSK